MFLFPHVCVCQGSRGADGKWQKSVSGAAVCGVYGVVFVLQGEIEVGRMLELDREYF